MFTSNRKFLEFSSISENFIIFSPPEPTNYEEIGASEPLVVVEKYDALTLIGLNRPSKRNALNQQLLSSLSEAITNYENDNNARSAVLYGVGGNFCAGLDLDDISSNSEFRNPVSLRKVSF